MIYSFNINIYIYLYEYNRKMDKTLNKRNITHNISIFH